MTMCDPRRIVLWLNVACLFACFVPHTRAAGPMAGSPHDFRNASWNTTKSACIPCHLENAAPEPTGAPTLAQSSMTAVFVPYNSPTFQAGPHQPSGVSLVCLSCHDGTVAINRTISGSDPVYMNGSSRIGPDLHTSHPISFAYDIGLVLADGALEDPIFYRIGDPKTRLSISTPPIPNAWSGVSLAGKTIDECLLVDHKVECTSCHDVHALEGNAPSSPVLLRIGGTDASGRADLLCRTCHIK